MITEKTTFIVGAGASEPYGLPIGSGLRSAADNLEKGSEAFELALNVIGDPDAFLALLALLKKHPGESIDGFLQHNQHRPDVMRHGKILIAALMGKALKMAPSPVAAGNREDWLQFVVRRLVRDAPRPADFAKGNAGVTFITFNFDSIIEDRLDRDIRNTYAGEPPDEIVAAIDAIRVIHMHGQLPPCPEQTIRDPRRTVLRVLSTGPASVHATTEAWVHWTRAAAEQINLVMDQDIDSTRIAKATKAVQEAKVVCCLGFGYEPSNLQKVGIPTQLKHDTYQQVFGSAYGLEQGERTRVLRRFDPIPIELGAVGDKCLAMLKAFDICRD